MGIGKRIAVVVMFLVVAGAAVFGIFYYTAVRIDDSVVDELIAAQKGPYKFVDVANDIGVASVEDLGFVNNGDWNVSLYYGKKIIKINKRALESQEFKDKLKQLGIVVMFREDDEGKVQFRITSWDEEVTQWSRVG